MSFDVNWNIDKYKEDHESEEHWLLRREFMERWKQDYPEERLVCLARVFANMEFLGCRYPAEVMQEVSRMSHEVVKSYRNIKKTKLQRTFVSASDAAVDRAKGNKREGGVLKNETPKKLAKIEFVREKNKESISLPDSDIEDETKDDRETVYSEKESVDSQKETIDTQEASRDNKTKLNDYLNEMANVKCMDCRQFRDNLFYTTFGRLVLLIRPWAGKLWNIQALKNALAKWRMDLLGKVHLKPEDYKLFPMGKICRLVQGVFEESASCQACNVHLQTYYENGCFSLQLNGRLLARATGPTKPEARSTVEMMAWNRLREETVSVLVKEQWIAQGDQRISVSDVAGPGRPDQFGTPVENSVAIKMMQMMGWKGGGLGADAQGIEEPIRPNMQMVNREGLGSSSDIRHLKQAANELMRRYLSSDTIDLDLVFSSEFSKEERAALHQVAQRAGLASRSYGDKDRFLVVKKKLDPFSLVHAVIAKGGTTPKYQVYIPAALSRTKQN